MVTKQTDILISGGGIAGLTLGIILADVGLDVHLLEPFPPQSFKKTKPSGRTVALMESSLNIIKATGVWPKLEALSNPMEVMQIIDESAQGKERIDAPFEAVDIGLEQFGYNIPNNHLRAALYEKAKKTKSLTLHEKKLEGYEVQSTHVLAKLEKGSKIKAKLIIGADGRNSVVRKTANIEAQSHAYDQTAITCLINHSKSHNNTSTEFHRPGGPLALVPLPGNQSSVVWVEKSERAEALLKLKKEEFEQALQDESKDILGGLTLETGPESWPLITLHTKELISQRTALIAEAAHVMSPITAQGLNLSLRDAASLAETIVDSMRLGLDIGSQTVLKKYARRRQVDIKTRIFGVDGMNRIVSQDIEPLKNLRRRGLKTVSGLGGLKQWAMHQGLAPKLDPTRLATGKSL